jgi:transcriptional regulator with XRE-family HTH domain
MRHPLAVLRTTIGLSQKEMGSLVSRAATTIQAIELGHLTLGQELAMLIVHATGVDLDWLLKGDASAPPRRGPTVFGVERSPGVYTRRDYESHRALIESPALSQEDLALRRKAGRPLPVAETKAFFQREMAKVHQRRDKGLIKALRALLEQTASVPQAELVRWKIRQLFNTLAQEYRVKLDSPPTARRSA